MPSIRLFEPDFDKVEEDAVIETLRSGYWASGSGNGKVKQFEEEFAEYLGCKNVVAVNSGTAALHLALSLLDMKGKEVILPALSFVSTANAILYNGGIPVFGDVDPVTLCLDNDKLPITDKTACIIPVHFGGMPWYTTVYHNIPIIEDSAHRIVRNSIENISCYSFHPVKNLAMPTGGAIASNEPLDKLKARRWCGITNRKGSFYDVEELGWNYYMNEISASIGLVQLRKLDKMNLRRNQIAKRYSDELDHSMPYCSDCPYHLFWILVKDRNKFRKKMLENGIETGTHYKPIDQFSLYKKAKLPVTDKIAKEIVTLPMHTNLSDQDVDVVINCANS